VDIIVIVIGAVSDEFERPGNLEVAVWSNRSALLGAKLETWNSVSRVSRVMGENIMATLWCHWEILVISIHIVRAECKCLVVLLGIIAKMVHPRGVQ
jgi:hypothetical protein